MLVIDYVFPAHAFLRDKRFRLISKDMQAYPFIPIWSIQAGKRGDQIAEGVEVCMVDRARIDNINSFRTEPFPFARNQLGDATQIINDGTFDPITSAVFLRREFIGD